MTAQKYMTSKSIEQRQKQKKNWLDAPAKLKKAGLTPLTTADPRALVKDLQLLLEENARLRNLRSRYVEHAAAVMKKATQCEDLAGELRALAKELDPVLTLPLETRRRGAARLGTEAGELLEKLRAGTIVTTDLIAATYPALSQTQVWACLRQVAAAPGVMRFKDHNKVRLVIKKEE